MRRGIIIIVVPVRLAAALIATLAVVALIPASTLADRGNVAVTRAYIQANYRLVQAAASRIGPIEGALRGVVRRVRSECPMAAASSPQDADSEQLSNEVIGAMVTAAVPLVEVPAAREFVRIAGRLTWSDRALTRTVHAYVSKSKRLAALAPPKLCSDVKSWAASGFRTLPASTVVFAPAFMSVWIAPGELPAALARYETPGERPLLRRTNQLEREFTEMEARAVETWGEIMDTLALSP